MVDCLPFMCHYGFQIVSIFLSLLLHSISLKGSDYKWSDSPPIPMGNGVWTGLLQILIPTTSIAASIATDLGVTTSSCVTMFRSHSYFIETTVLLILCHSILDNFKNLNKCLLFMYIIYLNVYIIEIDFFSCKTFFK